MLYASSSSSSFGLSSLFHTHHQYSVAVCLRLFYVLTSLTLTLLHWCRFLCHFALSCFFSLFLYFLHLISISWYKRWMWPSSVDHGRWASKRYFFWCEKTSVNWFDFWDTWASRIWPLRPSTKCQPLRRHHPTTWYNWMRMLSTCCWAAITLTLILILQISVYLNQSQRQWYNKRQSDSSCATISWTN